MAWSERCAACLDAARDSSNGGECGAGLPIIIDLRRRLADQRAEPQMNVTSLLSVIVDVVPASRSNLPALGVNIGNLLLALVDCAR
jgi:hypothetical protein